MFLNHYSEFPMKFDKTKKYLQDEEDDVKPNGLWLSDDSKNNGWYAWCLCEKFMVHALKHKKSFQVDLTNILHISSLSGINDFIEDFGEVVTKYYSSPFSIGSINWDKVATAYSGILVSPYTHGWTWQVPATLPIGITQWLYTWDCDSACIWDLDVLSEVSGH